jgi:tetratricopeptide (TPR) repeat protein
MADFPFSGGGLAAFPGLYSQYILILPFYFYNYSHNLYLDIGLEQGFFGLVAYLLILLIGFSITISSNKKSLWHWATLCGLLVVVLHGFLDDPLYGNQGTPLILALPGIAIAIAQPSEFNSSNLSKKSWNLWGIGIGFLLALVLIMFVGKSIKSYWISNLAAVKMAQIELDDFPSGRWDVGWNIDDLAPVESMFQKSLSDNNGNLTSHYRLGLITMQKKNYKVAIYHLERAYLLDPDHRGIRKSLGYCLVWTEQYEQAAMLLSGIPEVRTELKNYIWWWQTQGRGDLSKKSELMLEYLNESRNE